MRKVPWIKALKQEKLLNFTSSYPYNNVLKLANLLKILTGNLRFLRMNLITKVLDFFSFWTVLKPCS
jgi:hypothetical protein